MAKSKPAEGSRRKRKRPNARHAAFVAEYAGPGTGVSTARAVGFRGSDSVLAVTASRLLSRPEIRAAIEARGLKLPGSEGASAPAGPTLDTSSPTAFYREVAANASLPLRDRQRAMEKLEAAEGKSAGSAEELFARQRAKVLEVLRQTMDAAGVARRLRTMLRHATDKELLGLLRSWLVQAEELAGERDAA